jgi:peptidoglycan/xylan/chitin deacetylase (PgdA/CDA1 family)
MTTLFGNPVGRRGASILCYHAVQNVPEPGRRAPFILPVAEFERQLDAILADGWTFVSGHDFAASHLGGSRLPTRAVLLTFDDGFDDLEATIAPLLAARQIPSVAFVVTQLLGQTNVWDAHLGAPPLRLLGIEGLRRIAQLGVDIAPHSRTHQRLTELDVVSVRQEVAGAKSDLLAFGFPESPFFAYPYGRFNKMVADVVREAGIPLGLATHRGGIIARFDRLRLPRIVVERGHDPVALLNRRQKRV